MPTSSSDLAAWYRRYADKAEEPRIWHLRICTAERLEAEAQRDQHEQRIRERAYFLWERDGRPEGRAVDYWLKAQAELATQDSLGVSDEGKGLGVLPGAPARRG